MLVDSVFGVRQEMRVATRRKDVPSLSVIVLTILLSHCIVLTKSDTRIWHTSQDAPVASEAQNYISTTFLVDGEKEVRMRFGDIIVKETSISSSTSTAGAETSNAQPESGVGLLLRQVSSGEVLLQMIYKIRPPRYYSSISTHSNGTGGNSSTRARKTLKLIECEVLSDWSAADKFRIQFRNELRNSGLSLQVPPNHWNHSYFHDEDFMEYSEDESSEEIPVSDGDNFDSAKPQSEQYRNVTTRILQNEEIVGELQEPFDITTQQRLCRRLHRKMKHAIASQKYLKLHLSSETTSNGVSSRKKRELLDIARVPGTRWCGVGASARELKHMGGFAGADKCCRFHDLGCPYFIPAFSENYGLFNWRYMTLNHCSCDERFRSCLKTTNTGAANFVGKLFFNIVQTRCFVLKTEKICTNKSWWGKCLHYERKKQAHIRDPVRY